MYVCVCVCWFDDFLSSSSYRRRVTVKLSQFMVKTGGSILPTNKDILLEVGKAAATTATVTATADSNTHTHTLVYIYPNM